MTAVGKKRQAERNRRYAVLLTEARLLGLDALVTAHRLNRTPQSTHIKFVQSVIARKRAQK